MEESKKQILAEAGINVTKALNSFMQMEPMYEKFLNKFCLDPSFENLEQAVEVKDEDLAHLFSYFKRHQRNAGDGKALSASVRTGQPF